jgi:hypothetical protein
MDLAQVAARLAREASDLQRELDQHTQQQQAAFARLLATVPEDLRPLFLPLAPAGLVVAQQQVRCQLQHCVTRDAPWSFRVRPQGYGASALAPLSESKSVTIDITVDRIPLSRAPNQS